jgi:uncharacterized protein
MHTLLQVLSLVVVAQAGQLQVPQPVGYVNDFANVIKPDTKARIERIVQDVRQKSRGEIVVVTLPDLKGRDPADVAREIGRQWKVGAAGGPGDRARNAGVIILLVPRETSSSGHGEIRVEVGQGAEGYLTDATTGAIQDEAIPALRQGDYSSGLELITWRIAQRYANEFQFALDSTLGAAIPEPVERSSRNPAGNIPPFVWLIIFFVVLSMLSGSRRRRRGCGGCIPLIIPFPGGGFGGGGGRGGWGGGGFGGGFGGGGGGFGGFGGGGGFSGGGSGRSF